MKHIDYERDNPHYSQLAQIEYDEFLASLTTSNKGVNEGGRKLRRLLLTGEGKIVIPKREINPLSDALARLGI